MRTGVIGAGYVGLTTAACLAELGHDVVCCDVDEARLERIRHGNLPMHEPELPELVARHMATGALRFQSSVSACAAESEVVFVTVGTPSLPNGDIDLRQVAAACESFARSLGHGTVVAIKSTVSAGTCQKMRELIARRSRGLAFSVASNPEFLREGSAVADFMRPDRIVIGAEDPRTSAVLRQVYRPLERRGVPFLVTTTINAELVKHAANAMLALKIGFINEVADLCEAVGGDVRDVARGIGLDSRIGGSFLMAGPGFGGSCFPKDTRAYAATGRRCGAVQDIVEMLIRRNDQRTAQLARRVIEAGRIPPRGRVGILGLAFKAGTDDIRESASLAIIRELKSRGIGIRAHDPQAIDNARRLMSAEELVDSPYEAARGADALIVATEWPDYASLDPARIARSMKGAAVFDFRNVLPWKVGEMHGLRLARIGVGTRHDADKVIESGANRLDDGRAAAPM